MANFNDAAQQHSAQTGIPPAVYLALIQHENDPGIPVENYASKYNIFGMLGTRGTLDDQFNQFDQLMFNSRYGPSTQQLLQSGNIGQFFTGIAYAGYAAPSDNRPLWAANLTQMAIGLNSQGNLVATPTAQPQTLVQKIGSAVGSVISTVGVPSNGVPTGPNGRTYAQILGGAYQSPEERVWFLGQQGKQLDNNGNVVPIVSSGGRNSIRLDAGHTALFDETQPTGPVDTGANDSHSDENNSIAPIVEPTPDANQIAQKQMNYNYSYQYQQSMVSYFASPAVSGMLSNTSVLAPIGNPAMNAVGQSINTPAPGSGVAIADLGLSQNDFATVSGIEAGNFQSNFQN